MYKYTGLRYKNPKLLC
uniref:Uncharacterized protein n=1 Tax=Anguilla anguilla TaxID=7936 RepID=A0A0E9REY3_ANGAN